MSLPWSNSVWLRVSRHGIEATLQRGWPSREEMASLIQSGNAFGTHRPSAPMVAEVDDARARLIDLALAALETTARVRGAQLHVVLDDSLVHVDVVEGDFAGLNDHQLKVIAQACVAEMLGDVVAEWEVRWCLQPDERHLAICAIERDHLRLFSEAAGLRRMEVSSVQSWFTTCWNLHARPRLASEMVFAVPSGMHAVIAYVVERSICALSTGAWLDRNLMVAAPADPHVEELSSTPVYLPSVLDSRVDRLLASRGVEATTMSNFVAVLLNGTDVPLSNRWSVVRAQGVAP